jgi:hypothetical protein
MLQHSPEKCREPDHKGEFENRSRFKLNMVDKCRIGMATVDRVHLKKRLKHGIIIIVQCCFWQCDELPVSESDDYVNHCAISHLRDLNVPPNIMAATSGINLSGDLTDLFALAMADADIRFIKVSIQNGL